MRAIKKRLDCRRPGMTEKNSDRLRQFDDIRAQVRLVSLPDRLAKLAKTTCSPRKAARLVQTALAIDILLMAPMRLGNLVALHRDRHLTFATGRRNGTVHLFLPADEVKNDRPLEFELPHTTARLVALYFTRYRPHLVADADEGWLFPGDHGGHLHAASLSQRICKSIERYASLVMNIHLFRHLAAKLYLNAHPGDYETVRRLLGHKSLSTTVSSYCELDFARATRRYDDIVLRLRQGPEAA